MFEDSFFFEEPFAFHKNLRPEELCSLDVDSFARAVDGMRPVDLMGETGEKVILAAFTVAKRSLAEEIRVRWDSTFKYTLDVFRRMSLSSKGRGFSPPVELNELIVRLEWMHSGLQTEGTERPTSEKDFRISEWTSLLLDHLAWTWCSLFWDRLLSSSVSSLHRIFKSRMDEVEGAFIGSSAWSDGCEAPLALECRIYPRWRLPFNYDKVLRDSLDRRPDCKSPVSSNKQFYESWLRDDRSSKSHFVQNKSCFFALDRPAPFVDLYDFVHSSGAKVSKVEFVADVLEREDTDFCLTHSACVPHRPDFSPEAASKLPFGPSLSEIVEMGISDHPPSCEEPVRNFRFSSLVSPEAFPILFQEPSLSGFRDYTHYSRFLATFNFRRLVKHKIQRLAALGSYSGFVRGAISDVVTGAKDCSSLKASLVRFRALADEWDPRNLLLHLLPCRPENLKERLRSERNRWKPVRLFLTTFKDTILAHKIDCSAIHESQHGGSFFANECGLYDLCAARQINLSSWNLHRDHCEPFGTERPFEKSAGYMIQFLTEGNSPRCCLLSSSSCFRIQPCEGRSRNLLISSKRSKSLQTFSRLHLAHVPPNNLSFQSIQSLRESSKLIANPERYTVAIPCAFSGLFKSCLFPGEFSTNYFPDLFVRHDAAGFRKRRAATGSELLLRSLAFRCASNRVLWQEGILRIFWFSLRTRTLTESGHFRLSSMARSAGTFSSIAFTRPQKETEESGCYLPTSNVCGISALAKCALQTVETKTYDLLDGADEIGVQIGLTSPSFYGSQDLHEHGISSTGSALDRSFWGSSKCLLDTWKHELWNSKANSLFRPFVEFEVLADPSRFSTSQLYYFREEEEKIWRESCEEALRALCKTKLELETSSKPSPQAEDFALYGTIKVATTCENLERLDPFHWTKCHLSYYQTFGHISNGIGSAVLAYVHVLVGRTLLKTLPPRSPSSSFLRSAKEFEIISRQHEESAKLSKGFHGEKTISSHSILLDSRISNSPNETKTEPETYNPKSQSAFYFATSPQFPSSRAHRLSVGGLDAIISELSNTRRNLPAPLGCRYFRSSEKSTPGKVNVVFQEKNFTQSLTEVVCDDLPTDRMSRRSDWVCPCRTCDKNLNLLKSETGDVWIHLVDGNTGKRYESHLWGIWDVERRRTRAAEPSAIESRSFDETILDYRGTLLESCRMAAEPLLPEEEIGQDAFSAWERECSRSDSQRLRFLASVADCILAPADILSEALWVSRKEFRKSIWKTKNARLRCAIRNHLGDLGTDRWGTFRNGKHSQGNIVFRPDESVQGSVEFSSWLSCATQHFETKPEHLISASNYRASSLHAITCAEIALQRFLKNRISLGVLKNSTRSDDVEFRIPITGGIYLKKSTVLPSGIRVVCRDYFAISSELPTNYQACIPSFLTKGRLASSLPPIFGTCCRPFVLGESLDNVFRRRDAGKDMDEFEACNLKLSEKMEFEFWVLEIFEKMSTLPSRLSVSFERVFSNARELLEKSALQLASFKNRHSFDAGKFWESLSSIDGFAECWNFVLKYLKWASRLQMRATAESDSSFAKFAPETIDTLGEASCDGHRIAGRLAIRWCRLFEKPGTIEMPEEVLPNSEVRLSYFSVLVRAFFELERELVALGAASLEAAEISFLSSPSDSQAGEETEESSPLTEFLVILLDFLAKLCFNVCMRNAVAEFQNHPGKTPAARWKKTKTQFSKNVPHSSETRVPMTSIFLERRTEEQTRASDVKCDALLAALEGKLCDYLKDLSSREKNECEGADRAARSKCGSKRSHGAAFSDHNENSPKRSRKILDEGESLDRLLKSDLIEKEPDLAPAREGTPPVNPKAFLDLRDLVCELYFRSSEEKEEDDASGSHVNLLSLPSSVLWTDSSIHSTIHSLDIDVSEKIAFSIDQLFQPFVY